MVRLFVLLFLAQIVLAACALISCLSAEDGRARTLSRLTWVLVILFIPLIGSIAWFITGRPAQRSGTGAWPPVRFLGGRRQRPLAPDDDPEFLRSLGNEQVGKDPETLQHGEDDRHRREDETRRHGDEPPVEDTRPEG